MKIRHFIILTLSTLIFSFSLRAQSYCSGGRFYDEIFPYFTVDYNVTYGQNINYQGNQESLKMDIYEPDGDTASMRPLLLMFHGGNFLPVPLGELKNSESVVPICESFAKMGYVAVSADYRVGITNFPLPGPDSSDAMEAVFRAVHDAKACIRYFYKDAATANQYRIDTTRIYFGGSSAGALTAVHYIYLDDIAELPAIIDTSKAGLGGGLEGLSGNPGYSSRIYGAISLSGAVGDTAWIKANDEPLLSMHGTADALVPYGTAVISLIGIYPLLEVDGSASIHYKLDQLGAPNCLKTFNGASHTPHMDELGNSVPAYLDTILNYMRSFCHSLVCGEALTCDYVVGLESEEWAGGLELFPNPAGDRVFLRREKVDAAWEISLTDISGKTLGIWNWEGSQFGLERGEWPAGIYLIRIRSAEGQLCRKIIFQ